MMSSVIPSEKYSCSGSPLMLLNGKTAIEGPLIHRRLRRRRAIGGLRLRIAGEEDQIINTDRPFDVLQRLFARIFEGEVESVPDTVPHRTGNGDAAGLRNALNARRHVDAVAKYVVVFEYYITQVDTDAELNAPILWHVDITFAHSALNLGCTSYRIHNARELDQHSVTGEFDDATLMLSDLPIGHLAPMRFQRRQCA